MKSIYFLLILLLPAVFSNAQQKRDTIHAPATAKKMKVNDQLGLSPQQKADLKSGKKEYKAEKAKIDADSKLSAADKKAKMKELKKEKKAKADAVLTPEQKEKAKALKAERKKKS